jgi:tRNA (guanine37-N1)-methyltransferase
MWVFLCLIKIALHNKLCYSNYEMKKTPQVNKKSTAKSKSKKPAMTFHVVSLFPESLHSYIDSSIIGRAVRDGIIDVRYYNPRDYADVSDAQKKRPRPFAQTDDKPFGGGPGMVVRALPVLRAVDEAKKHIGRAQSHIIFFDAGGEQFTNTYAKQVVSDVHHVILICGRYEGIDVRVATILRAKRISIGPFVLTGGELPALVYIDTVSRQVPGVLGDIDSLEERRVASHDIYTRPEILVYKGKKHKVPQILLSGNHKAIELWKKGPSH